MEITEKSKDSNDRNIEMDIEQKEDNNEFSNNLSNDEIFNQNNNNIFKIIQKCKKEIIITLFALVIIIISLIILFIYLESSHDMCQEDEKCSLCDKNKNKCIKCTSGFKLSNGNCLINYSFKAIYKSNKINDTVKLFNNLIYDIIEMIVNDTILNLIQFINFRLQEIIQYLSYWIYQIVKIYLICLITYQILCKFLSVPYSKQIT